MINNKVTSIINKTVNDSINNNSIYYNTQEEVAVLARALANAGSNEVNLGQLLNVCTVNALGRVMLGRRVFGDGSGEGDAKADEFKSMVVEVMVLAGVFNIGDRKSVV